MTYILKSRGMQRGTIRVLATAPIIYGMIIPLIFMDLCTTLYQWVCFPAFGIPRISRRKYVQWVKRGKGLPFLDRFNCAYCSYANGVAAYLRAVLIETEKYWCPIKYAVRVGHTPPHPQGAFAHDGDHAAIDQILKNPPLS